MNVPFCQAPLSGVYYISMIASISGTILAKGDRFLVIETGGLGYRVFATTAMLDSAQDDGNIKLFTYHHVSETASDLFGFPTLTEVEFFEMLLSVSGIGPRTALSVMNVARLPDLKTAILKNDASLLTAVSGIGKKTAERIVLELRGKIEAGSSVDAAGTEEDATVIDALVALGYSRAHARDAMQKLPPEVHGVSDRVREALKHMGRHGK